MAAQRDKKTGSSYRKRDSLLKQYAREWDMDMEEAGCSYQYSAPTAAHCSDSDASFSDLEDNNATEFDDGDDEGDQPFLTDDLSFKGALRVWVLEANISHRRTNVLLDLLRKHNHPELPRDARTFLETPSANTTRSLVSTISGGQLWYQGIASSLKSYFRLVTPDVNEMELIFFVDGLPLHRSGLTQFWPILMRIHDMPNVPVMTVAIFCGESKPGSLQGYLQPFVTELNYLQANGLLINGRPYKIWFRAMIADTPARAYIKGVKSFNARYGCIKCKTRTTKDPTTKRSYYGQFGAARRTHEEFSFTWSGA
ncbi:uncharacterized protein LOC120908293 [Anopheles arabiensis]|uniref:uncharacterized protein LOC120908293 n=1 Tax=Anopheles arabiensis TaxID=7173 RepID=UPI001AACDC80|nr:uncharacterized protein LOC120908293 [Anopheles arabiensis]